MKNALKLGFLFCIMLMPFMVSASCQKNTKPFKLKEFCGNWVNSSSTVGGVGVNTGVGVSSTTLSHVTFDKKGQGTENHASLITYLPNGTISSVTEVSDRILTLVLTDPINGVGVITIKDPTLDPVTDVTVDFIALRNKKGSVNKLITNLVSGPLDPFVVTGFFERQQAQ